MMIPLIANNTSSLVSDFKAFVSDADFPCVGAKAALSKGQMTFFVAYDICSAWDDVNMWASLYRFVQNYRQNSAIFQTFIVIFSGPGDLSEQEFEHALWARIQSLSDKDEYLGVAPDPRVSADPNDPHFSLSFGGEAFFVVGMHAQSSRPARRFRNPALVFNLHDQFEQLRDEGRYEKLRQTILERDEKLSGSHNPMIARHGQTSEARQYSGRVVGTDWECPFKRRETAHAHEG
jgi:uncharacterized protein